MDTKLTLKLDSKTIERAKRYASANNISLSKLIESYLQLLSEEKKTLKKSALVESLSGILDAKMEIEHKIKYQQHIRDKYLK